MSVTLSKPIKRGDQEIKTIAITDTIKQAGSLRGLKLVDVLNFDYDAVSTLLTRTTSPQLTAVEIATMATGDFTALCEEITPFLTKAEPSAASKRSSYLRYRRPDRRYRCYFSLAALRDVRHGAARADSLARTGGYQKRQP